jgi:predicted kinase
MDFLTSYINITRRYVDYLTLIIFTGNVGSGKSTKARKLADLGYVVINSDSITTMIGGGNYLAYDVNKKEIYKNTERFILYNALYNGFDVVIDRTCMSVSSRKPYIEIGKLFKTYIISYDWGPGNEEYLNRRKLDSRGVNNWDQIYIKLKNEYKEPSPIEGFNAGYIMGDENEDNICSK